MIDSSKGSSNSKGKENNSTGNGVDEILQKKDFGASLRLAREKAALSLADVAGKLLISVDIIKALENSQTEALPALIFTQGYIRSYAKLLGVSAEEIIDDYVNMVPDLEPELAPNSGLPVQKCSNDKLVKLISYGFVVVAVIVFVLWFANADFTMKQSEIAGDEISKTKLSVQQVESSQNESSQLELIGAVDSRELIKADEKEPVSKPEMVNTEITKPETLDSIVLKPEVQTENKTPVAVDKLVLSALGDSWCEIQDSTGKRLYYQLLNRGEEIELLGRAPFMVFLGNAPKIRVEINNKIVDFENLINKNSNIASLEISKDAAVTSQASQ